MTSLKIIFGFLLGMVYQAQILAPFWYSYQIHSNYNPAVNEPYPVDWNRILIRLVVCCAIAFYFAWTSKTAPPRFSLRLLGIFVILVPILFFPAYMIMRYSSEPL